MNIQRTILQVMSKLPEGVLRRMGGAPIMGRGQPLDPMMQLLWKQGKKQPSLETATPQDARASLDLAADLLQGAVPDAVSVRDDSIPGPGGKIPVSIYTPGQPDEDLPITLFFHFGGYVIGSRAICNGFCGLLAECAQTIVVNVEYRLAPEHPFPAPIEDALAAYRWALEHGESLGGAPGRVAVAGDSAGGQSAAVIAQEARRQNWQAPICQVLIYPWLAPNSGLESYTDFGDAYPLTTEVMEWFSGHYFTDDIEKDDPWAAPLNEKNLADLPEALVFTAGFDPLRDEGELYAKQLEEAGTPTFFKCYEHLTHSFTMFGGVLPAAQEAMVEIADELGKRLHR